MNPSLEPEDIETLLEALRAWEDKDFGSMLTGILLTSMIEGGQGEAAKVAAAERQRVAQQKYDREKAGRKERSILLQAKLIEMRGRAIADAVDQEMRR